MPLTQLEETITHVVDAVGPSVVTISTMQVARDQYLRPFPMEGIGSGVLIDADGLIVTNHHVVNGTGKATVHLSDGRSVEARYVGGDAEYDVALLRIPRPGLPAAALGDSNTLRVGQLAIAIGSPFGQILGGPTVTTGVVSALHRRLQSQRGVIDDLIQSDAPINPGNSGGPLLNSSGEIIGINTAIIPFAQGIGFAVPVQIVKEVRDQILAYGHVRRPWIGISAVTHSAALARQNNIDYSPGALVFNVEDDSPAHEAGVREGDLIREVGDVPIDSVEGLKHALGSHALGSKVSLRIVRGGRIVRVNVVPRERTQSSEN
jgi:S1-C subfamily serine protease